MIRLLIAAPSPVVLKGLEALAASHPGVELVGAYPDLGAVEDLRPDVVLAAIPAEQIYAPRDGPAPAFVLLSGESQPVWTKETLRLGVRAVLPHDAGPAEILAAVEAAAAGLVAIDPATLDSLISAEAPAADPGGAPALTPRELEVLAMLADGAANKSIAWKLNISEHTAKFHVASILSKLNASSRTEAVTIGIRRGLVLL